MSLNTPVALRANSVANRAICGPNALAIPKPVFTALLAKPYDKSPLPCLNAFPIDLVMPGAFPPDPIAP